MSPLKEVLFDSFDEIIEIAVYEKISANMTKRSLFNKRNELKTWEISSTNAAGLVENLKVYGPKGELQTDCNFTYTDKGEKLSWKIADSSKIVLSETRYILENGLRTKIELYDSASNLVEYFSNDYKDGLLVLKKHYDGATLKDSVEYIYKGDNLGEERYLKSDGSVLRTVRYEYDGRGTPVKIEYFDRSGKLMTWTYIEYKYVPVDIEQ
jgi:hypothetical protein